ncbi:MAG: 2-oxoacid:acceptor oxidoreductase family protein [Ilumatobacteraceae bacterium]
MDDVTHLSLRRRRSTRIGLFWAVFYGLGSDGTVGANKHTAKIIGKETGSYSQAYFVYDSKKSGSMTVSHLRFDDSPIRGSYLVYDADLVAVHQFGLIDRVDVLEQAARTRRHPAHQHSLLPEETWGSAARRGPGADHRGWR